MKHKAPVIDFDRLQRVSWELSQSTQRAQEARQTVIATGRAVDRRAWVEALENQSASWERYWKAHRECLEAVKRAEAGDLSRQS